MFNTTNVNAKFNYNINAVSGTLRKSHPKSKFTIRRLSTDMCIFSDENPPRLLKYGPEVVILQTMLIGDNRAIIEYVAKKDFEGQNSEEATK